MKKDNRFSQASSAIRAKTVMFEGITHIVALGCHSMTGKDIESIFEDPYVFFVAWDHDGMYGLIGRRGNFLLLQTRRGLSEDGNILALFFACCVGFTASLEDLFDRVTDLINGATETDGKEKCK
jgi:hypothetical protein